MACAPKHIGDSGGPKIRPIIWAVVYLLQIPLYASVYTVFLSSEFYHSTVQYERNFGGDSERVRRILEEGIQSNVNSYGVDKQVSGPGWNPINSVINVSRLQATADELSFQVNAYVKHRDEQLDPQGDYSVLLMSPVQISVPIQRTVEKTFSVLQDDNLRKVTNITLASATLSPRIGTIRQLDNSDKPIDNSVLFPTHYPIFSLDPNSITLQLPVTVADAVERYWYGARGLPYAISRSGSTFARMLYMSAMTETTVGYGDIVPISTRARLAVTVEAISGVILIGCFINSLFQQRAKP